MTVVFPGLSCNMVLVVASIGSEGLLGTEALKSCLPHRLDLRTGQLWVDGQSTLQLYQQRQAARASAHLTRLLVLPLDSEIVAPVSICSPSGIKPGRCSLIEPQIALTEGYGVWWATLWLMRQSGLPVCCWSTHAPMLWCCLLSRVSAI